MNRPIPTPITGSTHVQSVIPQTIAPTITLTDPRVSDNTSRYAPCTFRLSRGAGSKQQECDSVHRKTDHPDDEHRDRGDVARVVQSADRFVDDIAGNREQQGCVGQRGHDLQPVQTEGPLWMSACRRRGVDRCGSHPQSQRIGGHVTRIRQQRERTGEHADDHLDAQEGDDQDEGDQQRTHVTGTGTNCRTAMIVPLVTHVTSVNPLVAPMTEWPCPQPVALALSLVLNLLRKIVRTGRVTEAVDADSSPPGDASRGCRSTARFRPGSTGRRRLVQRV